MSDQLHDKILSCDDLATKTVSELDKMRKFYQIKIIDLKKQDIFFRYKDWILVHRKLHDFFLILSIIVFIISFWIAFKITIYALVPAIFSICYILVTGIFVNDVRSQAIMKNIATINYMMLTFKEKDKENKTSYLFRKRAQTVYEIIKLNEKINLSDLRKEVRKKDSKMDKNTIQKILDEDLFEVIEKENSQYSTQSGKSYGNVPIYKIKNV